MNYVALPQWRYKWTGAGGTPAEFQAWRGMIHRCMMEKPKLWNYEWICYAGRGIKVCDRWLRSYDSFLEDMGRKPHPSLSIDRINNDGNYEPSNCRWATREQQLNNKRNNVFIEFQGNRLTLAQWGRKTGISASIIGQRRRLGWTPEAILTTPHVSQTRRTATV